MNNSKSQHNDIFEIDGSYGEGGGSILRLSAAFSVLTQKPIKYTHCSKYFYAQLKLRLPMANRTFLILVSLQ